MPKPLRDVAGRFLKGPSQGPSSQEGAESDVEVDSMEVETRADASKGPSQGPSLEEEVESDVSGGMIGDGLNRKRSFLSSSFFVPGYGYLGSDTETEETVAAKVSTARRGRKKVGSSSTREEFLRPLSGDGELEGVLLSRKFGKRRVASDPDITTGTGSDTDVAAKAGDVSAFTAQELRAHAGSKLACILDVARKSGNLKGSFIALLKESTAGLREVVDALAGRSEAEETRRLRADNSRLRLETEALKAEVKALRRGFTEAKTEAAAATTAAAAAAASGTQVAPAIAQGVDLVEELKRSLTSTFGQMLNARLAGIEERLLPAPVVRPPLRADAVRAAAAAVPPTTPQQAPRPASTAGKRAAPPSIVPVAGPSREAPVVAVPQVAETWATVTKKGKGKGKKSSPPSAPVTAPAARVAAAAPVARAAAAPKVKVSLQPPKSAAVVMSLKPAAVDKGVTYSAVLQVAQDKVNLQELGIDRVQFRQTATGARMLEIPGSQNGEKADRLAEKLREVLSEVAVVTRPLKVTDLRVTGLDDAATKEKVAAAVAEAGRCDVRLVKAGEIRSGLGGAGSTLVSCPIPAAKLLLEKGRLIVGWSSARVVALGERPMRCYRCMGLGHTRPQCPAMADRGALCFRCGGTGHKAAECGRVEPRCAICAESGRPSGHIMGGRSCVPPKTKGKAAGARTAPAAPEGARQVASEEVEMAD